jgi:REP element-mobilizing transposase RayT
VSGHRAYQLYAHITWHTWNRIGCVNRDAARDVSIAITCAARRTATVVLRSAVLADHVHVLISFRPDTRISDFVRLAKTIAAFRANRRVAGTIKWARGFYAASLHKAVLRMLTGTSQDNTSAIPIESHDRDADGADQADPGRQPGVPGERDPAAGTR